MNALPKRLETLVREALARQASDLFLIPGEPPAMRINGLICRTEEEILSSAEVAELVSQVFDEKHLARLGSEVGEIHKAFNLEGESYLHICAARAQGEITLMVRNAWPHICSVEQVGMPEAILRAIDSHFGLIVFSGLTGSGKSTSAYSLVEHINANWQGHICTIEDPIISRFVPKKSIIQQREIGVDVPDAVAGIQAARLQDLDVLFLNEITSFEALQASLAAAETGHLVITVLHSAATPEEAIQRMIDVYPPELRDTARRILAHYLRCVSCQLLVRRASGKGRTAAYATLVPDDEMRRAIAEGRNLNERQSPLPPDCKTIEQALQELIDRKVIAREEMQRALLRI